MNIRDRYLLIPALILALFLLHPVSAGVAGEVCEEGYPLPEANTDQFRQEGVIEYIEDQSFVMEDRMFWLLPSTQYFTHVMGRGSIHLLHEGQPVGFIANGKNEVLILWLKK